MKNLNLFMQNVIIYFAEMPNQYKLDYKGL